MKTAVAAVLLSSLGRVSCFVFPPPIVLQDCSLKATRASAAAEEQVAMEKPSYTPAQLRDALDSLLVGSSDPSFDARHIYGHGDTNHVLSMLQIVTATTLLDTRAQMADGGASIDSLLQQGQEFATQHGPIVNLRTVIQSQSPRMALAAEFKRASPSKGDIAPHLQAGEHAMLYAKAGANIISVLTEPHWFKGSLADLTEARLATNNYGRPAILRKDFVVNEYMIAQAAAAGADTILLIVATLPQHLLKTLIDYARSLQMEPLVEVHADEELDVALQAGAKVIGVNNRNLHTFQLDLGTTQHVAQQLQDRGLSFHHFQPDTSDYTVCALSGMSTASDVNRYRDSGVGMCLIGESLMRATDPTAAIKSLCLHPDDFTQQSASGGAGGAYTGGTKLVKVCGLTNAEDALVACRAGANLIGVIFAPKSKRLATAEQAREVVEVVQNFGERRSRSVLSIPPDNTGGEKALPRLVASARLLEEASRRPLVVGVFQNQSPEFIQKMVKDCGLDLVQLHGNEGMAAANVANCGVPAIRVVDIETDPETGKAVPGAAEHILGAVTTDPIAILLDTSIKGSKDGGGTGVTFDWSIAQQVQDGGLPVIIAGGLTVDNVKDAVGSTRPWGVDVASGVEASHGIKDHEKVQDFVRNARDAATEANKGF